MYLRKSISFFKVKNVILYIIGIFLLAANIMVLGSLYAMYYDDIPTFLSARATPECIRGIIYGVVIVLIAYMSTKNLGDARFFSNYFELDLDGRLSAAELAKSCGLKEKKVRRQLKFFHIFYMKNYTIENRNEIVLESKKIQCECKSCGAPIEKREYFAGKCSYCGGSDVFAKVLTDNRFYSISTEQTAEKTKPDYYRKPKLEISRHLVVVRIGLAAAFILIAIIAITDFYTRSRSEEYLKEALLSGEGPNMEHIRRDMIGMMVGFGMIAAAMIPWLCSELSRLKNINIALKCAEVFAAAKQHFVAKEKLPAAKNPIRNVYGIIRRGYARNCAIELVEGLFRVSLAKKITRDKCPHCGAHIVDVKNELYVCPFCNVPVLGVVEKK